MALVKCRECGQEISSTANSCPNCGCPTRGSADATSSSSNGCTCSVIAFIVFLFLGYLLFLLINAVGSKMMGVPGGF